jgi:hypothetical protein
MANLTEKRDDQFTMRLSKSERARLEAAAIADDRKLANWARKILLIAADFRKRRPLK